MKKTLNSLALVSMLTMAHGTTPFPAKIFENNGQIFAAGFAWPDQNDKVLIIRGGKGTSMFSLDQLGIYNTTWTTAGSMWYQQSIGLSFVSKVKGIEGIDEDIFRSVFYFRNIEGKEAIINLSTNKLIERSNIVDMSKLDEAINKKAASLLESADPFVRETGAMHLGYSGTTEHLSELDSLLQDKALVGRIFEGEKKVVYHVRDAAAEAIRKIKLKNTPNKSE